MFAKDKQVSEMLETGVALALTGGFLDAYSYICRGEVFANAQTGNMVLLALNIAKWNKRGIIYYLIPILAFAIGILIAEYIRKIHIDKNISAIHWRQSVVFIEIIILILVAFVPKGALNPVANVSISFVCSLQVQSFRRINGNAVATTMCTGNLRSGSESLFKYIITRDSAFLVKSIQYFVIIGFFIFGSVLGLIFTHLFDIKAVFISAFILLIIFVGMFIDNEKNKNDEAV